MCRWSAVRLLLLRLLRNSVICEESVTHCSSLQQRTNGQFTKCTPTSALSFTAAYMWALSFNGPASSGDACQSRRVAQHRALFEFISVPAVCQGIGPVTTPERRNLRAERVTIQRAADS